MANGFVADRAKSSSAAVIASGAAVRASEDLANLAGYVSACILNSVHHTPSLPGAAAIAESIAASTHERFLNLLDMPAVQLLIPASLFSVEKEK